MGFVQVIIDDSTNKIITGNFEWDRANEGTLIAPALSYFPTSPQPGEILWRIDESILYRRDDTNTTWVPLGGFTSIVHANLRQLIHFIDNGPADGFASGAYRETTGTVFPTAIIWYNQAGVGKKKIVEKLISWSGAFPSTITWKMYDASETLLLTVTDTLTYSGPFETSRIRAIA